MGVHIWEIPITKCYEFLKKLYQLPILYNIFQCGAKLSLLLVYERLAPLKWYKLAVWAVSAVIVASSAILLFLTIFPCRPIQAAWDLTITEYQCINRQAVYKAQAIAGAVTDTMVLLVPIPVVVSLNISCRRKMGLICFFGIGALFAEANLSIICAALPTINIFLGHVAAHLLGSQHAKRSYAAGHSTPASAMPTIGGTGEQRQILPIDKYGWYEDGIAYPLDTIVDVEGGSAKQRRKESQGEQEVDGLEDFADGNSERGIIQTRTTTVSYSK
ncbi:hypothetical protein LQW54_000130 [Pestalotiopsis sp. IQ-011]